MARGEHTGEENRERNRAAQEHPRTRFIFLERGEAFKPVVSIETGSQASEL
jgi:hypothetical protein